MAKASIGNDFLAETTEGPEADAVLEDNAAGNLNEGLPDGLESLRSAYQEFWDGTHHPTQTTPPDGAGLGNFPVEVEPDVEQEHESFEMHEDREALSKATGRKPPRITKAKARSPGRGDKQRFGLPEGFVPRMQRFGRSVLLEMNVYCLPNGQEFIPCRPTGTLGIRHLYALLTAEQYLDGRRGSVYVRSDGRIFDYSVASANPIGDMFDTGYTIYDLERTGRYAPTAESITQTAAPIGRQNRQRKKKKKTKPTRSRRAATAG